MFDPFLLRNTLPQLPSFSLPSTPRAQKRHYSPFHQVKVTIILRVMFTVKNIRIVIVKIIRMGPWEYKVLEGRY